MRFLPPCPSFSRVHYAWIVLAIGTLAVFGALGLARFGYTSILPAMQHALGLDNTRAGMLATANMLGYLAFSALCGALVARYGARAVITVGLLLTGLGMLLTGLAQSFTAALFWRAITGMGGGLANVAVMGMLAAWFVSRKRGFAAGIAVTGSSFGLIFVGPLVPALLTGDAHRGWRIAWWLFGAMTLLLAILCWWLLRNRPADIGLHPLGYDAQASPASTSTQEKSSWRQVYSSKTVWHLGLVYSAFGASYVMYMTFFTRHLIDAGGYTVASAGKLFMLLGWCSLLCGVIWGMLSDLIGRKWALALVYGIHAIAFSLFAVWPTPAGFTLSAILYGLSAWSIPAIMTAACGDMLGPELASAAFGFTTVFFGVGQALGPSLAGRLADATGSFATAFLLAGVVALLGSIGASTLRPLSPK